MAIGRDYTGFKLLRLPSNRGLGYPVMAVAKNMGYAGIAGWTVDSGGYRPGFNDQDVINYVIPRISDAVIILCHFINDDIDVIPDIIERAGKLKLKFVTLSELLTGYHNRLQRGDISQK